MNIGRNAIPRFIANCYVNGTKIPEVELEFFKEYVTLSAYSVSKDFESFLMCSYPGFLSRQGELYSYLVPYNLVSTFPTLEQLSWVEPTIASVKLKDTSRICFSGSSTFIGELSSIGDLDFCEYLTDIDDIGNAIISKMTIENPVLAKIKCGEMKENFPFQSHSFSTHKFDATNLSPFKMDYILKDSFYSHLPVTNVIIAIPDVSDLSPMHASFAFQEVVVEAGHSLIPQRKLHDPNEFGRYVEWLRAQVIHYINEAEKGIASLHLGIKALKRALSWFLIVGLEQEVNLVIQGLKEESVKQLTALSRAAEVRALQATSDPTATPEVEVQYSAAEKEMLTDQLGLAKTSLAIISLYMADQSAMKSA